MIVVTGIPRSGTSAIMQTLKLLGIPVAGEKFPAREVPELNPKGFYELDNTTMFDGIYHDNYKGMAVKLLGFGLAYTDRDLINKVILTERNPLDCQMSILKGFEYHMPKARLLDAVQAYDIFEELTNNFLEINSVPVLRVHYWDLTKNPEKEVGRIAEFVGVKPTAEAVNNIDRRSS
jgi:hypothetical protein